MELLQTQPTATFDPATNTFNVHPSFPVNVGTGSFYFTIPPGFPNAGSIIIHPGNSLTSLYRYDGSGGFNLLPATLPSAISGNPITFRVCGGAYNGYQFIGPVLGGQQSTLFNPNNQTFIANNLFATALGAGASAAPIFAGTKQGSILVTTGGSVSTTSYVDFSPNL